MVVVLAVKGFKEWLIGLTEAEKAAVEYVVELLKIEGVNLGHPHSTSIVSAPMPLRELRTSAGDSELRVFYAFDPERFSVLLTGGDKAGKNQKKFYKTHIQLAHERYLEHVAGMKRKGKKS